MGARDSVNTTSPNHRTEDARSVWHVAARRILQQKFRHLVGMQTLRSGRGMPPPPPAGCSNPPVARLSAASSRFFARMQSMSSGRSRKPGARGWQRTVGTLHCTAGHALLAAFSAHSADGEVAAATSLLQVGNRQQAIGSSSGGSAAPRGRRQRAAATIAAAQRAARLLLHQGANAVMLLQAAASSRAATQPSLPHRRTEAWDGVSMAMANSLYSWQGG